MMKPLTARRIGNTSEEGFTLLLVIFLLAVFIIALSVAAPKVARDIQRDRELETMNRGKQYIRAIQLYYKKFHRYPPSIDALINTDGIRFLRKKYADPTTGKAEWNTILFGQAKSPTALGLFGQPLAGTAPTATGIGTNGGSGVVGASTLGSGFSSSSDIAGSSNASASSSVGGSTSTGTTSATGMGTGTGGQTFGGAGIIGVSPNSTKQSILVYKGMNHYSDWEFVYNPAQDMSSSSSITGGNAGAASGVGNSNSGSGSGSSQVWSPNGNLPVPSSGSGSESNGNQTWSPNGNLPVPNP
jgi:type II secretory pathway pseudopilin PulG